MTTLRLVPAILCDPLDAFIAAFSQAIRAFVGKYVRRKLLLLGTGPRCTGHELGALIVDPTDFDGEVRRDATRPAGPPRRALDARRAWDALGFVARTSHVDGLCETIASREAAAR